MWWKSHYIETMKTTFTQQLDTRNYYKLNMNLYQQCKIFQPWVENVKCMKVRFVVQGCFTGVMLMFRWYSEVFSEVICCSTTFLPVFRILLFRWCSTNPLVFRVPLIPCFGVPGFIVCRLFPLYSIVHTGS